MELIKSIKAWYRLKNTKSIGYVYANRIIEELGNPIDYIGIKSDVWNGITFLTNEVKETLQKDEDPPFWDKVCDFFEQNLRLSDSDNYELYKKLHFITILDEDYPEHLKNIFQAPLFITAYGDISLLQNKSNIAIVGTRKPSSYGKYSTEKITESLVNNGFTVTSGLALGIDTIAHKKAVELNGTTIAVMACGLDMIYPPQNKPLARDIIKNGGLLISENLPCTPFEKHHFPQRNRIISGLSKAVCVIEGKPQSGAMITAKLATEQNRDVYALPGDISKPEAEGPNQLIKAGAKIITEIDDIANDYISHKIEKSKICKVNITNSEKELISIIKKNLPEIHIDQLIAESGYSIGEISELLFMLEMKNVIRTTNNSKYALNYDVKI